jgi:hypothetical protein
MDGPQMIEQILIPKSHDLGELDIISTLVSWREWSRNSISDDVKMVNII